MKHTKNGHIVKKPLSNEDIAQAMEEAMEQEMLKQQKPKRSSGISSRKAAKKSPAKIPQEPSESSKESDKVNPSEMFGDAFIAISDVFATDWVSGIELPKIILRSNSKGTQSIKEKSSIMISFDSNPKNIEKGLFKKLLMGLKKSSIKLQLQWADSKLSKEASVWVFEGARIAGIDFGTAEYARPEPGEVAIEVEYNNLTIDGVNIS